MKTVSCLVLETFKITDVKLHIPIVNLSTKDSLNLTKQLSEGFKRSVYCNSYQTNPAIMIIKGTNIYKLLNASFQGVRRLFVLAYVVAAGAANDEAGIKDNKKYFFQEKRLKIITYWLMEEIFMISQLMTC